MSGADTGGGAGSWDWWGSLGGLAGDPSGPHTSRKQRKYLESQGFVKQGGHGDNAVWIGPGGQVVIGQKQAIKMVRYLKKIAGVPKMPPGQWEEMVGPQSSTPPFIPPLHDIRIPPSVIDALPGWGSIFARAAAPFIAGALFWPTAAGQGSDLRDYYAKNAPRPAYPTGPRGRRVRGRAQPRRGRRPRAVPKPKLPPPGVLNPGRPAAAVGTRARAQYLPAAKVLEAVTTAPVIAPPIAVPSSRTSSASSSRASSSASSSSSSSSSSSALPTVATPTISTVGTSSPAATSSLPSTVFDWLKMAARLGMPYLGQSSARLPKLHLATQAAPLTETQAGTLPYAMSSAAERDCSCARTKRRRKKTCRNPVTKRKRETRGGHRFVTITKRLDCERGKAA